MRRLVVCCDGTWNQPYKDDSPTNVVRTVRAICPSDAEGVSQIVYYDPGVGTGNFWDRLTGGGFGVGLSQNVQDAYLFLVSNYQAGDDVFLFGFSRGAYTVRSLAGLIGAVGILRKRDLARFPDAYRFYRTPPGQRSRELEERLLPPKSKRKLADVRFLGVWDTVGSLGIPVGPLRWLARSRFSFHDVGLGRCVRTACHALAIDERRRSFAPAIWEEVPDPENQKVEQVWFAGVHSNVGGGYANAGLSDVAFRWMMRRARGAGLYLDWDYIDEITEPRPPAALYESRTARWKLRPPLERELLATHIETERVHRSVLALTEPEPGRIAPAPYRPANLDKARARHGARFEEFVVD